MIKEIEEKIKKALEFNSKNSKEIEGFRIEFLGKKGHISRYFSEFKKVKDTEKKEYGLAINKLKSTALDKIEELKKSVNSSKNKKTNNIDLTRPASMLK